MSDLLPPVAQPNWITRVAEREDVTDVALGDLYKANKKGVEFELVESVPGKRIARIDQVAAKGNVLPDATQGE